MKRALSAAMVFLVATLVSVLMGFVGNTEWQECWKGATKCKSPNPITGECCSDDGKTFNADTGTCK